VINIKHSFMFMKYETWRSSFCLTLDWIFVLVVLKHIKHCSFTNWPLENCIYWDSLIRIISEYGMWRYPKTSVKIHSNTTTLFISNCSCYTSSFHPWTGNFLREFSGHVKVLLMKLMPLMVLYNNITVTHDVKMKLIFSFIL